MLRAYPEDAPVNAGREGEKLHHGNTNGRNLDAALVTGAGLWSNPLRCPVRVLVGMAEETSALLNSSFQHRRWS